MFKNSRMKINQILNDTAVLIRDANRKEAFVIIKVWDLNTVLTIYSLKQM
ncbi:hypothetical protein GCM10008931_44880 [Oceanobacillus oncorhynchi subsp. oncorhynchi]